MKKLKQRKINRCRKIPMKELTHISANGEATMVDVSSKEPTVRKAVAEGHVHVGSDIIKKIKASAIGKGNVLETARIAGILAAKKTAELIPLCHPLLLDQITIELELKEDRILLKAEVKSTGKTGVEMEALTAVTVSALAIYDMCKALSKQIVLGPFALLRKSGGRSGDYVRTAEGSCR